MIKITPKQLVQQWLGLTSKYGVNVTNFKTMVGPLAVRTFQESFVLRKFNDVSATPWPSRKNGLKHPLLYETGSMFKSIKVKKTSSKKKVVIYTDESEYIFAHRSSTNPFKYGVKNNKTNYNRDIGFVYAAIHNMGGKAAGAEGKASLIKQRQFIGESSILDNRIREMGNLIIFDGFPR